MYEIRNLSVCTICIHLLANGEYNDGTDTAERTGAAMLTTWGDQARYLCAGDEDYGYCTTECDGCGTDEHGDRYHAVLTLPIPTPATSTTDATPAAPADVA